MNKSRFNKNAKATPAQTSAKNAFAIRKNVFFGIWLPLVAVLVLVVLVLVGMVVARGVNLANAKAAPTPTPHIVYVTPEPVPTPVATPTPSPSPTPTPTVVAEEPEEEKNYYGRLGGTADGGANYMSRVTFVGGDAANKLNLYYQSITDDKVWYAPSNHGVIMDKLMVEADGTEYVLPEAVGALKPEILLFSFCGVNTGSRAWSADKFVDEYEKLILTLKQNAASGTQFVIMGLFPITDEYEAEDDYYKQSNDRIADINRGLEIFAYNNECFFLDVNGVLRGSDGSLKDAYWSDENHILNREGYRTVYNYIKTHQVLH